MEDFSKPVWMTGGEQPAWSQGGEPAQTQTATTNTPPSDEFKKYEPGVGKVVDGFRYKGGNPRSQDSWEKVEAETPKWMSGESRDSVSFDALAKNDHSISDKLVQVMDAIAKDPSMMMHRGDKNFLDSYLATMEKAAMIQERAATTRERMANAKWMSQWRMENTKVNQQRQSDLLHWNKAKAQLPSDVSSAIDGLGRDAWNYDQRGQIISPSEDAIAIYNDTMTQGGQFPERAWGYDKTMGSALIRGRTSENVANIGATSRENVANISANVRREIATLQDRTRRELGWANIDAKMEQLAERQVRNDDLYNLGLKRIEAENSRTDVMEYLGELKVEASFENEWMRERAQRDLLRERFKLMEQAEQTKDAKTFFKQNVGKLAGLYAQSGQPWLKTGGRFDPAKAYNAAANDLGEMTGLFKPRVLDTTSERGGKPPPQAYRATEPSTPTAAGTNPPAKKRLVWDPVQGRAIEK